jgi:UDP-glucuronate 4-epimerase
VKPLQPVKEECTDLDPISPYGATKLAAERLCAEASEATGLKTLCYRLFSVYGSRLRPDLVISRFTCLMHSNRPLTICGTGETARDYTYIDDAIQGLLAGIEHAALHDVFNLGSSRPITLTQLVEVLSGILARRPALLLCAEHSADPPTTWADIDKARRYLGYSPRIDIEVGLRRFVQWYLQQLRQGPRARCEPLSR